jgi:hypothetical protein
MIESDATVTKQRPPYVYGDILSRSLYMLEQFEYPGIGRFLSQGAIAGAFTYFLLALGLVLLRSENAGNGFIIYVLPLFLGIGMLLSMFGGLVIWGCARLGHRRVDAIARARIGLVFFAILLGACFLIATRSNQYDITREDYVFAVVTYLSTVIGCASVAGSRLQPWRELVRGATALPSQSRLLTGITGVVLRVVVVFFLMESILALVCVLQQENGDLTFLRIAIAHFLAASIIVFARMKFWLLLPLALLVNVPIAFAIRKEFSGVSDSLFFYVMSSYLAIWAAFLITRWGPTYPALAFLKQELRYYLID